MPYNTPMARLMRDLCPAGEAPPPNPPFPSQIAHPTANSPLSTWRTFTAGRSFIGLKRSYVLTMPFLAVLTGTGRTLVGS
jgi:hypothetical protein